MKTQTYFQKPNKQGKCPLYVRYFHKGIFYSVPVGYSIFPYDFDKSNGLVKSTHVEHQLINYKAMLIGNRLMEVAKELELKSVEPTRDVVKIAYIRSIDVHPLPMPTAQQVAFYYPIKKTKCTQPEKPTKHKKEKSESRVKPEILEDLSGFGDDFVPHLLRFKDLVTEWINTNANITGVTRTQRFCWLNIMLEFSINTSTSLSFDNFDLRFYNKYGKWLMFESDHDYYNASFGNSVKRLKTFLNWCQVIKGIEVNQQYKAFKVLTEEKQIDDAYLDRHELELVWNYKTYRSDEKAKTYEKVIDLCTFQNITGLRFSDMTFKGGLKVVGTGNSKMLVGKTKKSRYRQQYQIPLSLDSRIEQILNKYGYNLSNVMSDVEYNRKIKELLQEVYNKHKLHHTPYNIYRYKFDKQYLFQYRKHEMISSHSNRRSWVTWVYKDLRLPEQMILKMMGSKSNTELKKYIALDSNDILLMVNSLHLS